MNILEILGKIGFDWPVALANLVNFLIIFVLLKYFVFKPLARGIEARRKEIDEGLDNATSARTALQMAEQEKDGIVMDAKQQANIIIASAKQRGDELLSGTEITARERAEALVKKADKEIARSKKRMESELRGQAVQLVVSSVESILNEELTPRKSREFADRALNMMRK
ncbi:MAG: F0F1 ATP synthase subunit B [Candidatus Nomurabacteria bacterium]|nr:F0F1 ATP synthase subunit B [Candidatus Nomurabacteria bacterium]